MPQGPSNKMTLQSTPYSSIWEHFDSDLDTEAITEHLLEIALASDGMCFTHYWVFRSTHSHLIQPMACLMLPLPHHQCWLRKTWILCSGKENKMSPLFQAQHPHQGIQWTHSQVYQCCHAMLLHPMNFLIRIGSLLKQTSTSLSFWLNPKTSMKLVITTCW